MPPNTTNNPRASDEPEGRVSSGEVAMQTLGLEDAAKFLRIHPKTLAKRAAAGLIPGVKEGRAWVFLEIDLVTHLRSKYLRRVSKGEHEESSLCHSTIEKTRLCGGLILPIRDNAYSEALGLATATKRRNTTTS